MYKFTGFTEKANRALNSAIEVAENLGHTYIGSEHLLMGLVREDNGTATTLLLSRGVTPQKVEELIRSTVGVGIPTVLTPDDFTPRCKHIIELSVSLARSENAGYVGTEHLLGAILREGDGCATYILSELGVSVPLLLDELSNAGESRSPFSQSGRSGGKNSAKTSTPNLDKYGQDLTKKAQSGEIDPVIGREKEIERVIQILSRRTKNNPCLIGEPGVGKTAIAEGLALRIAQGEVPELLKDKRIVSLDLTGMVAGTKYRGDFEERIKQILDEIKTYDNPIVYIDEIHNIVGAGALNGSSLDGGSLIKGYLLEGKIRFIGATTYDDYKKYFEKDKALVRRFQVIEVKETSIEETIDILEGVKDVFEEYHKVKYTDEALKSAVNLSFKYINDRFLPDKAIDIIDEAGAFVDINREKYSNGLVDNSVIEEIIAKMCNIPKKTIENTEINSLKILEDELKSKIFGQNQAVDEVSRCIKMSRAGLNDENKPVASMLFVGPTGVGKTEIAKVLAKTLGIELIRFDMSEYGERHAASKLIGSPPGYVGYEEGGLLTDTIRKKPNCVLLLDEIEKAHPDILSVLLQVMDYATLTDNKGRKADFRNVILIMTSNAGARDIGKNLVGFARGTINNEAISDEVKRAFTPEFRNRLDKVIVFNQINKDMAIEIANKELNKFKDKLKEKNIELSFSDEAITFISEKGLSKEFGAREIIRVINSDLKPILVDELLFGDLSNGGKCNLDMENNKFKLIK